MIPPAISELHDSSPPDSSSRGADGSGYDPAGPDAETTPMAAILGDGPPPSDRQSSGRPAADQTPADQTPADQTTAGQPAAGQPAADQSAADQPAADQSAGGNAPANPPAAHPSPQKARAEPGPQRIRGPFEAYAKSDAADGGDTSPQAAARESDSPQEATGPEGGAKLDQIKDLYLTAEVIGEDALDKHFQLVSDRQRQLIREYFDQPVDERADSHDAAS